jgi:hypothetical protein
MAVLSTTSSDISNDEVSFPLLRNIRCPESLSLHQHT